VRGVPAHAGSRPEVLRASRIVHRARGRGQQRAPRPGRDPRASPAQEHGRRAPRLARLCPGEQRVHAGTRHRWSATAHRACRGRRRDLRRADRPRAPLAGRGRERAKRGLTRACRPIVRGGRGFPATGRVGCDDRPRPGDAVARGRHRHTRAQPVRIARRGHLHTLRPRPAHDRAGDCGLAAAAPLHLPRAKPDRSVRVDVLAGAARRRSAHTPRVAYRAARRTPPGAGDAGRRPARARAAAGQFRRADRAPPPRAGRRATGHARARYTSRHGERPARCTSTRAKPASASQPRSSWLL